MLRKIRNRKNWAAWLLTAALAGIVTVCGLGGLKAAAENALVDGKKTCSLTVQMPEELTEDFYNSPSAITVKLYKVASIQDGSDFGYEAESGFTDLELDNLLEEDGGESLAEFWDEQAVKAYGIISEAAEKGNNISETYSFSLTKGAKVYEGTKNELPVGLYLMVVDSLYNAAGTAQYDFSPRLISLPMSSDGEYFDYELTVFLKYEEVPLYGDLIIMKHLTESDSEYLPVSFVFRVTAVEEDGNDGYKTLLKKDGNENGNDGGGDGEDNNVDSKENNGGDGGGEPFYDRYVQAEFSGSGTEKIFIEGFPAGTLVKVEEVYSGGSYEQTDGDPAAKIVEIVAKELVENYPDENATATVTFSNKYNGGQTGGYGITNHYKYVKDENGKWVWKIKETESSGSAETSGSSEFHFGDNTSDSGTNNEVWNGTEDADIAEEEQEEE